MKEKWTKETLAALLNGREYGSEMTQREEDDAEECGLLVIFGASDDLAELRGAFCDEQGCYSGGTLLIHRGGILGGHSSLCRCEFCGYDAAASRCVKVEAKWCDSDDGFSWSYETTVPHATFDVKEGSESYCRGIVIDANDLPKL